MRILAISDVRVQRLSDISAVVRNVNPDLILYAGDDVDRFGPGPNSWSPLALSVPYGLAGIIGNDCLEESRAVLRQPGCHDLHNEPYLVGGIAVLGLQGAPIAAGIGHTLYSERGASAHLERQFTAIGDRPAILVSHAPPYGVLDLAMRFGLRSIGSKSVLKTVKRPTLKAVICGHVHIHGGQQTRKDHCLIVNCASHDEPGAPLRYAVLTWEGGELSATLHLHEPRGQLADIRGMNRTHAETLDRSGITTVGELYNLGIPRLGQLVGGYAPRYWSYAKAQLERRPIHRRKPSPIAANALFLDVETSLDCADVWMIAYASAAGAIEQVHTLGRAKQRRLLAMLDRRMKARRPSQFVQWGSFDRNALTEAYRRYWKVPPTWLDRRLWVDAMTWMDRAYAMPLRSLSIKDVSAYFGYTYAESGLRGETVGSWYSHYLAYGTRFSVPRVLVYNRDDVEALRRVVHSVLALASKEPLAIEEPIPKGTTRKQSTPHAIGPSPSSEIEYLINSAVESYQASIERAGTLSLGAISITVAKYAAAMRKQYGLPIATIKESGSAEHHVDLH